MLDRPPAEAKNGKERSRAKREHESTTTRTRSTEQTSSATEAQLTIREQAQASSLPRFLVMLNTDPDNRYAYCAIGTTRASEQTSIAVLFCPCQALAARIQNSKIVATWKAEREARQPADRVPHVNPEPRRRRMLVDPFLLYIICNINCMPSIYSPAAVLHIKDLLPPPPAQWGRGGGSFRSNYVHTVPAR